MARSISFLSCLCLSIAVNPAYAGDAQGRSVTFSQFNYVRSVASSMTHVYFATTEGIIRYDKSAERWEEPLTGTNSIQNEEIRRVWVGTFDERVFVQTDLSLYEYDLLFERWFPITELPDFNRTYTSIEPPDDMLPAIGETYLGQGKFVDRANRTYEITELIDDGAGTLWAATWGHGPAKASSSSRQLELLPFGLIQRRAGCLYYGDNLLWVGGSIQGEFRTGVTGIDPETFASRQIESGLSPDFPADDVNCIIEDDVNLYLGTPQGVLILDRQDYRVKRRIDRRHHLPDNDVTSLKIHDGSLYIGTAGGLAVLTAADTVATLYRSQFYTETMYALASMGDQLWIGASSGAFRYTPSENKLQRFQQNDMLASSPIYDIQVTGNLIWFAGNAGLVRLNVKSGKVDGFQEQSSLPIRRALAVNEWIAAVNSNRGVTVFFLDGDKTTSREFTVDDGLASSEAYDLELDGDFLWIATERGLTRLLWNDPQRID